MGPKTVSVGADTMPGLELPDSAASRAVALDLPRRPLRVLLALLALSGGDGHWGGPLWLVVAAVYRTQEPTQWQYRKTRDDLSVLAQAGVLTYEVPMGPPYREMPAPVYSVWLGRGRAR